MQGCQAPGRRREHCCLANWVETLMVQVANVLQVTREERWEVVLGASAESSAHYEATSVVGFCAVCHVPPPDTEGTSCLRSTCPLLF